MLVLLVLVRALYVSAVGCRLARRFASRLSLAFTGFVVSVWVCLGVSGCVSVSVPSLSLSRSLPLSRSPSLSLVLPLPLPTLTMENTFSNHMPTGNVLS